MSSPHIETGYRINFSSSRLCLNSVFRLHNETANIWTHLLGVCCFVLLGIYIALAKCEWTDVTPGKLITYLTDCNEKPGVPVWPLFVHVAGGIIMLGASTCHHMFMCSSQSNYATGQRCDYSGIAIMIAGSSTPPFFYGFMCPEKLIWKYVWLMILYSCNSFALFTVLTPACKGLRWLNAVAWLMASWSCAPGLLHLGLYPDTPYMRSDFLIWPWLTGAICYSVGAVIYAIGFPERYFKKTFDIFGQSHTIFHVCILAGAALHFYGSLDCYRGALEFTCPAYSK